MLEGLRTDISNEKEKSNIKMKWEEKLHAEQEKAFIGQETHLA